MAHPKKNVYDINDAIFCDYHDKMNSPINYDSVDLSRNINYKRDFKLLLEIT